ncbi:MAG: twin-arginine translocation pathway signal, partial [Cystobacter sp.]
MELTRRDLVAAFLGSAVAASACRKTAPREPIPGALVDRVVEAGHRLRGSLPPLAAEA